MPDENRFYGPGVAGLLGTFLIAASFLIPPSSPDYSKRWLVFLFGLMIDAQGCWLWKRNHRTRLSPELDAILDSILLILIFGVFSVVFLAGGLVFGDELRGGMTFLPPAVNNRLGRILFSLVGGVLGIMVMIHVVKLLGMIVRWIRG